MSREQTSPPKINILRLGMSSFTIDNRVGAHDRNVIPILCSIDENLSPERMMSNVPITRVAPADKGTQISSTEASKETEKPCKALSFSLIGYIFRAPLTYVTTFLCISSTPLGLPVVPDV